jgi:hypothetical protein
VDLLRFRRWWLTTTVREQSDASIFKLCFEVAKHCSRPRMKLAVALLRLAFGKATTVPSSKSQQMLSGDWSGSESQGCFESKNIGGENLRDEVRRAIRGLRTAQKA